MRVEIQDVLFWMDAIRNSKDRYRTLESFWKGQVNSKIWLITELEKINHIENPNIVIHGGWNGVLSSLLFNSNINPTKVLSLDIDAECQEIAYTINKRQEMQGRFQAVTDDMVDFNYDYDDIPDIVINTSSEHITQEQYDIWLEKIPEMSLVITQSNNFFSCEEHINCSNNLNEFVNKTGLDTLYKGELEHSLYTRFMVIGYKKEV